GRIKQTPPFFSAIKKDGKKFYELAREGKFLSPKARDVVVYSIKLIDYQYPKLKIFCKVSSGTYIRALARDIGRKLKTGAYLSSLKRVSVGRFKIEQAVNLKDLDSQNWQNFAKENL
ncbi:MAG: tRNA pseudouridine(55) synthase TruB, partial [Microgenomates group bacterium]